jgi:hypothetical protein
MSLKVTFNVQPFLICDTVTTVSLSKGTTTVHNPGWAVQATAKPIGSSATITNGTLSQTITGETALSIPLETGDNELTVTAGSIKLTYYEMRL